MHDSNYIPNAVANPLVLDVYDSDGKLISNPGFHPDGYMDILYTGDLNGNFYTLKLYHPELPGFKGTSNLFCIDIHKTKAISSGHYDDNYYRGEYQPITVSPVAAFDTNKKLRIYFGTGKYDDIVGESNDKADKEPMSFYCLIEDESICGGEVSVSISPGNVKIPSSTQICTSSGSHKWVKEDGTADGDTCFNCIFDLNTNGERITDSALVAGSLVFFITFVPNDDPCVAGGDAYLYVLDYMCRPLDINPLEYSGLDITPITVGSGAEEKIVAYKAKLGQGMPTRPVLDSSGKYVLVQTSDAKIHKIPVEIVRPVYLKGWKEE
jgi:type IV pilus assembly protein PilY1